MSIDPDAHYASLQRRFPVTSTGDYERLVTAWGNSQAPVHRWFHFKEAYSHLMLPRVIKDTGLDAADSLSIFDPFAGSGTTVASAGDYARDACLPVRVEATETNPFLHLLSSVKGAAYSTPRPEFLKAAKRAVAAVARGRIDPLPAPALSTFHRAEYFSKDARTKLGMLAAAVLEMRTTGASDLEADALSLCLAAAVEPASHLRRDGRALRFEPQKEALDPVAVFVDRAHQLHADWMPVPRFTPRVRRGDAREGPAPRPGSADLVLFSPPYPNNIDYTEVYKLENWQLGLIRDQTEFAEQRQRTLRSHPSVKFDRGYKYEGGPNTAAVEAIVAPICEAVPHGRYHASLVRTVRGYTDDMLAVLSRAATAMRSGGHLVYVVGNSFHGGQDGLVIAADLIMAQAAELCGLEVTCMDIARVPTRRRTESPFLRETVVFARKP